MKGPSRNIIAAVLMAAYLAITVSPLAHLAVRPATGAQAVIAECSGDCDICGCSPELRATHTCCCWQKRMKEQHGHHDHEDCEAGSSKDRQPAKTTLSCSCPCGSGKQLALWGAGKFELLPYRFSGEPSAPPESPLFHHFRPRLTTRHGDPPDPPPKLSPFS
ncbi:MAG: hypothetical protein HYV06_01555 [Deltaproteobacteria bacterium]|nr:hypothetical protein [Deltaproteobacteria bacterium]